MKTVKETMGRPGGAKTMAMLRALALAIALAAVGIPVVSWAQQVPDAAAGARRPKMDSAANGVPVVDIVAPNAQGVSHNQYQRFDVDSRGVILNNSAGIVRTQLGGYIAGNDNLKGGEASLILNEVTSALPSSLRGYVEVGGKAVPVIIANPYGITCDGCGVINSQRFTLTTGTPVFGGSGSLDAFHVTGGSIAIGAGGLDGSQVDRTDLIARAVQINGQLWAKDLNVVAGSNDVGYADASVHANAADAARPAIAIDVAALGGMYADKIRLVGTEAGVGVVSSGAIAAQAGDLELTSAGEVRLGGTTVALNHAALNGAGAVTLDGTFGSQNGDVAVSARGPLAVHGSVIAGGALAVNAASDIDVTGRLSAGGNLSVYTSGALRNTGLLYAGQAFDVRADSLRNDGTLYGLGDGHVASANLFETTAASTLHAGGSLSLDAAVLDSQGTVDAGAALSLASAGYTRLGGALQATSDVTIHAGGTLDNSATVVAGHSLDVQADLIANQVGGALSSNGDLAVTAASELANQGTLYAAGGLAVQAASFDQGTTAQAYGGTTAQVTLAGNLSNEGSLVGGQGLVLKAAGLASQGELGTQQGDASFTSTGDLTLSGNTVVGGTLQVHTPGNVVQQGQVTAGGLDVDAGSLDNGGTTYAKGVAQVHLAHDLTNGGALYADGTLALTSDGQVINSGTLHAGNDLLLTAHSVDSTTQLDAGRDLAVTASSIHLGGSVQAVRDVSLATPQALANDATVVAGRDLAITAGSLTNRGALSAVHDLAVTTSGDVTGAGQLYAGHALSMDAHALALDANGSVSAGDTTTLRLTDHLLNAGNIVAAQSLNVQAASIDSTGSLGSTQGAVVLATTTGDVHLGGVASGATSFQVRSARDLLLDGQLTAATLDLAAQSMTLAGALHASSDAVLDAASRLTLGGDVFADGVLSLHAGDAITQSGTTHAGGDLSLTASTLDTQGTLDAGNDLTLAANTVSLAGHVQSGRDLHVQAADTLTQAANVVAARDAQLRAVHLLATEGGSVSTGRDLTVSAAQDASNAGVFYAAGVLSLDASSLAQAATGQIQGMAGLHVSTSGALENDGAIVGGNGLDVQAGSLRSGGQLGTTAGDVSLITTQGDLALAGTTVSAGQLTASSAASLAQTGSMSATGASVSSAGDLTLAGDTSVTGTLSLDAGRDLHNTGNVYAGSNLDLHTTGDVDNQGGIAAEQGLTARVEGALTQGTAGALQTNGNLSITAARVDSAGTIASAKDTTLDAAGDIALSGTTQAGGSLSIGTVGAVTNGGHLVAGTALSIDAGRIANTGALSTDGALGLHATAALDNQGSLYAGKALSINADSFTQGTTAQLSGADDVTVDVAGTVNNAGTLVAARSLDLRGGSVSSTGTLGTQQGDTVLKARQGDLTLAGTVASAGRLDATATGALRQSGQLAATDLSLSAQGDLQTQGDLTATTAQLDSGAALTQGGTLSAGSITLDGATVSNIGHTLSSGDLTVHGGSVDVGGVLAAGVAEDGSLSTTGDLHVLADTTLVAHGSLLAGHALDVQANAIDLSDGTQRAGGDATLLARTGNIDHTGGDLAAGGTLTATTLGSLINRGVAGHDARMQANALRLTATTLDNGHGQLLQTGTSALTIRTAGVLDNTGGTVASNGNDLALHGSRVVNTGGSVELAGTGTLDVSADQDVDNRQGTLASNGATKVTATTAIANDGGLVNAHGATTLSAASLSNTANGAISGNTLTVTTSGAVNNSGGLLQATGGNLGLTAASLSNGAGTIQSAPGAVTLGIGGVLDNGSGTIAAGGLTQLNAVRIVNAGTIAGGQLSVQATDTLANTGGHLQSRGALDVRATNGLNNNAGSIEANGATTLSSASISNIGGRIANASTALTQITSGGGIDNRGGTLGGQGDVNLSGSAISNAQGGTLVAGNTMTLSTGQLDNTTGKIYAGNTFNFVNAGASAINTSGKITAGQQLNLTLASLDNSGGAVQAGIDGVDGVGNVMLDIRNLVGQGAIIANNTLGMHLVGDYIQAAGSSIKANGGFSLAVDGQFVNNGSIQAVGGLAISAANITNNAGALLNSANTQLTTGGTITNAGSIQGDTVGLHAGVVNNTGSIMGGSVTLQAGTVINGADFGGATGNPDYQSGTIAATRNVDIYTNDLLNRDAQIFSLGDINVAGAGRNGQGLFDTRAGQIDNLSGSIQANGNILLAANQINNVRRVLQTSEHTLTQAEYDASEPLPRTDFQHIFNKVQELDTWTEYHTISETVVGATSAQSQIVAGGNISLYGSVNNNTSTIASAGFLAVNQQGAGGGTGMVFGNENVANQALSAGRTIQAVAVHDHVGCGWELDLCEQGGGEKESISRTPDNDPSHYLHDNVTILGAVMSGAQGVSISGVNVSNGGVTGDGHSVGNARLDPNAQAIGLSSVNKGNAQGAQGVPVGAAVDPATGHAPQVLGGAGQPLAGVTLPTGGIFSVRGANASEGVTVDTPIIAGQVTTASAGERSAVGGVDASALSASASGASARNVGLMGNAYLTALLGHAPSGNYLIETNARFADYSQFISSDYLLDKLGVDPARTMMRLGDGFYEQQLVTQQVTQLTGRTYLSDYSNGLQEYQALMNNATQVAQSMNLSVGVALTAAQVNALTQDMVWMVQQNVNGHEVLVPVVYLAKGNLGLTAQGAVIAGKDVSIDAKGSLTNDGLIRGQNSTLLTANDLLNSGRISSDGLTAISASGNVTNINGRIDGAGVSVVAGGDIRSENVGGLIGSGMATASITATQGLQISAGHDLSLDHTKVMAGGDALLTAGHDMTLAGQGASAGGSLALSAGNNLSLQSSTVTTHPYRWSGITQTQTQGVTLSAGQDLSLVAGNDMSLSVATLKAGGDAALQAGHDLTASAVQGGTHWTTTTQASSIDAGGSLSLQAGHDLGVQAGTLKAGGDMALLAGHDLALTATTNGTATQVTHDVTNLSAGGNLVVAAGHDTSLEGTQVKAGGAAVFQAGNDLNFTAVTDSQSSTASWKEGKKHITQTTYDETVRGVSVAAGTGVQVSAGHDATLDAATIATKTGDLTLAAGHDLTLTAEDETHTVVTDTKKKKSGLFSSKTTTTHDTSEQVLAVGTTLGGDAIHMAAGNDLTTEGASVTATGDIALAAGHDINLLATTDTYNATHEQTVKKSGFVINRGLAPVQQGKKTVNNDDSAQHVATGTLLSGDSISVAAGHDVLGEGAKIAGTHDVIVAAGNDLRLTTAVDTYDDSHSKSVTTTGYSRSGMNELYGTAKDSRSESSQQVTHTGSVVGSTDGEVTLTAGGNLHLTGTDVISQTGTTIVGKNVTIDADTDTLDTQQSRKHSEGGITGGLGGGLYDLAMSARSDTMHASQADDDRLKALYAAKAAFEVKDGVQAISNMGGITDAQSAAGATGINIQVGIGGSSASSKTSTHDDTSFGGHIASGRNVTIAATGGDLTLVGAEVTGKNVALAATNDINLLSQSEAHSLKNDSTNGSGGIGVSFGSDGLGIYAQASVGSGKAHGNGQTHAETTINADDTLTIVSGHDTTIEGAQLKGNQVVADIGNNLTIRSEQDTDDFASKTMQAGGKIMVGITQSGFVSGSAYYAASKVDSHYTGVNEVSGIKAGDGGFQIDVGGTTHLIGGQIASTADASKNVLSTGDLIWEDVHNESKYSASQVSFSGGSTMSSNIAGAIGAAVSMATPQHGNSSSDTHAGIAAGTIIVRNDPGKDLGGLDRNPTLDDPALKNSYDAKKVQEHQELGALAGYVGMRAVGDIASYMASHATTDADKAAWSDGGINKTILHGLVGAATAALGNGNVAQGAAGAAASEIASTAMEGYLLRQGIGPDSSLGRTLMQLGSAAVGGAVGGGGGAATALAGAKFNDQHHAANYLDKLEGCQQNPSASGCVTILKMQGDSSYVIASPDAANGYGLVANVDSQTHQIVSYTFTDGQGQPTMIMEPKDYNAFVNNPLSGFMTAFTPEYALTMSNALNDAASGEWGKAGANLSATFSSGAYWRDMAIGMIASTAALPSAGGIEADSGSLAASQVTSADAANAIRANVLQNIAESQAARASSNVGSYFSNEGAVQETLGIGSPNRGAYDVPNTAVADVEAVQTTSTSGKSLQTYWPPNGGFWSAPTVETLPPGYQFSRYGGFFDETGAFQDLGAYGAPADVPYGMRALAPGSNMKPLSVYEVVEPMPGVQSGKASPWFGELGLGQQHQFPMTIQDYLDQGYIKLISRDVPQPH